MSYPIFIHLKKVNGLVKILGIFLRIHELQRFRSLNCPVPRAGLPHMTTFYEGRAAIDRSTFVRNRTCSAVLWGICCRSVIGDEVVLVKLPSGKGHKKKCYVDLEKSLKEKKTFIKIINRDHLCCAKAIVTTKARIDKHPKWNSIRKGNIILKGDGMHHISYLMCLDLSIWLFTSCS